MSDIGINLKGDETVSQAVDKAENALNDLKNTASKSSKEINSSMQEAAAGLGGISQGSEKAAGALNHLKNSSSQTAKGMNNSWQEAAIGIGALYLGLMQLKDTFTGLIEDYGNQAKNEAMLTSALKATGNAAAFTRRELMDMAGEIQNLTTLDGDSVVEAQALMLTFKNIGHDVFPRAIEAATDLAAMFGQDLTQSTIMLSKALNEPVAGINAMRRVGVSFSEEAIEMIKRFEELGDTASAQKIILQEVEGQVKGTAAAFASMGTGGLKQLEVKFGDLREAMGEALYEGLIPLFRDFSKFIDYAKGSTQVLTDLGLVFSGIGKIILGAIAIVVNFREVFIALIIATQGIPLVINIVNGALVAFGGTVSAVLGPIGLIIGSIGVLIGLFATFTNRAMEAQKQLDAFIQQEESDFNLIKGAQEGTLTGLENYYEAQSLVEKRIKDIKKAMAEHGQAHKALYDGMIDRQQSVLDNINKQIEAEKASVLLFSAVKGATQSYGDYARAIELTNSVIDRWQAKLLTASETEKQEINSFIEGQYQILAAIKTRQRQAYIETDEYKKALEERMKMDEQWSKKAFEISATRLLVLNREEDETLKKALQVGADITNIKRYYSQARQKIIEDEVSKEVNAITEAIKQRGSQEKAAMDFLTGWAAKSVNNRIDILNKEKETALNNAQAIYESMKKVYGESLFEDITSGADSIIDSEETTQAIKRFLAIYKQAINEIQIEYSNKILEAQKQINEELELGGKAGVELYSRMLAVSSNLLDPLEKQRRELEAQKAGLIELKNLLPQDYSRLSAFQKEVADKIPALLLLIQKQLQSVADQPLVDMAKQVMSIAEQYKDPLIKAKEAVLKDIEVTDKYLKALTLKKAAYQTEEEFTAAWGKEVDNTISLLNTLDGKFKEAEKEIENSKSILSFWDLFTESLFSIIDDFNQSAFDRYAQYAGKNPDDLSQGEKQTALSFSMAANASLMLADTLAGLAGMFINLITSSEAFQQFSEYFTTALQSIVDSAVIPLITAIMPLATFIINLASIIVTYITPVFQMLGVFIQALQPLWIVLGSILLNLIKIFVELSPIIFFVAQIIGQLLTPVLQVVNTVLSAFGGIIAALQPVFDLLGYAVDGVARVFQTLWTIADFLISPFRALGELIFYIISFQWDKIGGIDVITPQELVESLKDIWSKPWGMSGYEEFSPDFGTIPDLQMPELDDYTSTLSNINGGNTTVTRAPDIYIYQYFQAPIIGESGKAEIGEYVVSAIQAYAGIGGKVSWEEA